MCKSPFPYGDCHIETVSRFIQLPIWKRGFQYGNGDSRFLYGDPHFHVLIPLWKFNYARNEHVNCFLLYKFLLLC
jgi:hypothetical protein